MLRLAVDLLYLITVGEKLITGCLWMLVMKGELCDAGHREPEQKLCQPCVEAVARIWRIVNAQVPRSVPQAKVKTKDLIQYCSDRR